MKRSLKRLVLILSVPVAMLAVSQAARAFQTTQASMESVWQGSDLTARVNALEKRIAALKQALKNPQNKQHQGAVSSLENRKNTIKFKLKGNDAAANAQLEQDIKQLEDKVSELEKSIK